MPCLGGKAFQMGDKIIPFGNVDSFLTGAQLSKKYQVGVVNDEIGNFIFTNSSLVNFMVAPVGTNFDPIGPVISDSMVEKNLDRMFSLENIAINENCDISNYDSDMLQKFEDGISVDNNKYCVKLVWNDKIKKVPHNFDIAKAVLGRVYLNLKKNNLLEKYEAVFTQQLSDSILEPINLDMVEKSEHVFIPHRHVLKEDETCTTKLRVVLNCSLKTKDNPSLNEAAYQGVNLLQNLFELLIKIRSHKYLVMSDIKHAFLNIFLKDSSDRNKFTILWFDENEELIAWRYKTICFGFTASPFILHQVIKFHLKNFPDDQCNEILRSNVYVDNVFYTGNDEGELEKLYHQVYERMDKGGFTLRSWSSNSDFLCKKFDEEDVGVSHSSLTQKILGYIYDPYTDKISVSMNEKISQGPITKRPVLANIASVFDPLGLFLPIVTSGKI